MLVFRNPGQRVVLVAQDETNAAQTVRLRVGTRTLAPVLKANSFNILLLK